MAKILNYGSLNIDYTYRITAFPRPGETISTKSLQTHAGGKGLNQSVALARAGAQVYLAGKIGQGGGFLKDFLKKEGIDTSYLSVCEEHTGHAIIEVDADGQNCILLYGGTNRQISIAEIDAVLSNFGAGDLLLLQNEITGVAHLMHAAAKKKMRIFINPAPLDAIAIAYPLELAECIFLNEVESTQLAHVDEVRTAMEILCRRYPKTLLVFTLGQEGAVACKDGKITRHAIYKVPVIDTTAAGDTFTGFFIADYVKNGDVAGALQIASKAAALTVSRAGASESIPHKDEVLHAF